jgi:hypothetical protein
MAAVSKLPLSTRFRVVGAASDSPEVRRLRYAFGKPGLRLHVKRPRSYEKYSEDDLLWTITRDDVEIQRDVSLDVLHFMAEDFGDRVGVRRR